VTKKEHLLGLTSLWEDLNNDMIQKDFLRSNDLEDIPELNEKPKKGMKMMANMDADSFEESNLIAENRMIEEQEFYKNR